MSQILNIPLMFITNLRHINTFLLFFRAKLFFSPKDITNKLTWDEVVLRNAGDSLKCNTVIFFILISIHHKVAFAFFILEFFLFFLLRAQSKPHKQTQTCRHRECPWFIPHLFHLPWSMPRCWHAIQNWFQGHIYCLLCSIHTYKMRDVFYEHESTHASHSHLHVFHVAVWNHKL